MTEGHIQDSIRLALSHPSAAIWRNNIGYDRERRIRYGVGNPGGADLIGLVAGRFVAIEVKTPSGRVSAEQRTFGELVESKGGIYMVLRSAEEARQWLASIT